MFCSQMPRFRLRQTLKLKDGSARTCLEVTLTANEQVSDDVLNMIDPQVQHLSVTRESHCSLSPIHFYCSRGALGRFEDLQSFCVFGVTGFLEDGVFEGCTRLSYLYLGASEKPILYHPCPSLLSSSQLSEIHLNGYGFVRVGAGLQTVLDSVERRFGEGSVIRYS